MKLFSLQISVLALVMALALPAWAESTDSPDKSGRGAMLAQRVQALHDDLKLNPAQESAWNTWKEKMKPDHSAMKELRRGDWSGLTAIQRMEKKLEITKLRVGKLEDRIVATKAFYAQLSDDQRKIFDQEFVFHKKGGGMGGAGKFRKMSEQDEDD